jgi:hypothetical protein
MRPSREKWRKIGRLSTQGITEEEAMGYQKEYRGERDNGKTR